MARLLEFSYFKCLTLRAALEKASQDETVHSPGAVHAIGFAYVTVNHKDPGTTG